MTHILVKWLHEESWDVYPIRALVDSKLGFRLMTEENAMREVRGSVVDIRWSKDSPPAEAELLDFGRHRRRGGRRKDGVGTAAFPLPQPKFTRGLLKHLFTEDELRGKSLYGKVSNSHKDLPAKEGLDPVRLEAVTGM
ncbi:hypothetical protein HPB50_029529 [Hyalomma asiaticum]|nr:hypothetical protein HPB50_029529 [Hyalomma asiaticum]